MTNREKQIEKMAKRIHIATNLYYIECIKIATYLFEKDNCRIIDKDSVVLSKEEYKHINSCYNIVREETAEKILTKLQPYIGGWVLFKELENEYGVKIEIKE